MTLNVSDFPSGKELAKLVNEEVKPKALATKILQLASGLASEAANNVGGAASGVGSGSNCVRAISGAAATIEGIQFMTPRGKFDLGIFEDALVLYPKVKSQNGMEVPWSAIEHVVVLDSTPDDRDKGKGLVALAFKSGSNIKHGKNTVGMVAMKLDAEGELSIPAPSACSHMAADGRLSGPPAVVLCTLLGGQIPDCDEATWVGADPDLFASSTGQPFVAANLKAQPGWLTPLPGGWLYLGKPSLYVRHRDVEWVELQRAGGSSSTFDISLHGNSSTLELGQIDTGELPRLQRYLAAQHIKMSPPGPEGHAMGAATTAAAGMDEEDLDEDEEEDDSDYDPGGVDSDGGAAAGGQPLAKRRRLGQLPDSKASAAAAATAGHGDDDDDDDDDDVEGLGEEELLSDEEEDEEEDENEEDDEGSESVSLDEED